MSCMDLAWIMWKLRKKSLSSILKKHTGGRKTIFACLFLWVFKMFWHWSTLCKGLNQAADSVNSELSAFSSVQITPLWQGLHGRRENCSPDNSGRREQKPTLWKNFVIGHLWFCNVKTDSKEFWHPLVKKYEEASGMRGFEPFFKKIIFIKKHLWWKFSKYDIQQLYFGTLLLL